MTEQNFIALDLELNQPSNRIIQVGVCIGNAVQKPEEYLTQKWYLDPNEPIDTWITDLTGITNSDIKTYAVSHETVAREINNLIKKHKPWLQPVVWGYDDAGQLRREFERNNVEFKHFGGRWLDVKTIYNFLQFSLNNSPNGNLQQAMLTADSWFEGSQHRADIDAFNTLKFWFYLMNNQKIMFDNSDNGSYNKTLNRGN